MRFSSLLTCRSSWVFHMHNESFRFMELELRKERHLSVKSAYRMLVETMQRREAWLEGLAGSSGKNREEGAWKSLWKTQVPGKFIMFLWRLLKPSLPTKDVRAHRHMSSSSSCGLYGSPDSWRHSLLECTISRCSWALVNEELGQRLVATTEPNAKQ